MNMADTKLPPKQPELTDRVHAALEGLESLFKAQVSPAETADGYRWAMMCSRCCKPGLFFTVDPNQLHVIKPEHWEHIYKTASEGWNKKFIPCQCCLDFGKEKVLLNLTYVEENYDEGVPGGFKIEGRARTDSFRQWHTVSKRWKHQIDADRRAIEKANEASKRQAQLSELTKRG